MNGRVFEPILIATSVRREGGTIELLSPGVGLWRGAPDVGALLSPGEDLGELEVLGVLHRICVPRGARGVVTSLGGDQSAARRPVGHGQTLVVLDPAISGEAIAEESLAAESTSRGDLLFRSPSSGRFYSRPDPDMPPFVSVGDEVKVGQTVCLLEVMKTFNRVNYGGDDLPARARIVAICIEDGGDLDAGAVILELESLD